MNCHADTRLDFSYLLDASGLHYTSCKLPAPRSSTLANKYRTKTAIRCFGVHSGSINFAFLAPRRCSSSADRNVNVHRVMVGGEVGRASPPSFLQHTGPAGFESFCDPWGSKGPSISKPSQSRATDFRPAGQVINQKQARSILNQPREPRQCHTLPNLPSSL